MLVVARLLQQRLADPIHHCALELEIGRLCALETRGRLG